ncbi:MAG TPA: endolytic transglycosylase MltG [Ktedonobacterales bacterium]
METLARARRAGSALPREARHLPSPGQVNRVRTPTRARRKTYLAVGALAVAALVVFGGALGVLALIMGVFQPAGAAGAPSQQVVVRQGESTAQIADDLSHRGLIRNSWLFRLVARNRGLDRQLQAGVYMLSPAMTMDQMITTLEHAVPDLLIITVPEGARVTEYPSFVGNLPNFNSQQFLQIVQTGQFPGRERYWYVSPPSGARYALEGYLFPSTYYVDPQSTAEDVVKVMLDGLGLALCPGPAQDPNRYIYDQAQCRAHARVVDSSKKLTIFAALAERHLTLEQALTLASIVQREARSPQAKAGVASVYYNRYLAASGIAPGPEGGGPRALDADPTVQYAVGTLKDPWPTLRNQARAIAPGDPYNTYTHAGLPPGPIAGSGLDVLIDVVSAPRTDYYYFITGTDHQMHYAHTYAQQQRNIAQFGLG